MRIATFAFTIAAAAATCALPVAAQQPTAGNLEKLVHPADAAVLRHDLDAVRVHREGLQRVVDVGG